VNYTAAFEILGGSDGARTRDIRRDRRGDSSIKSTKVQSFDDAITGAGLRPRFIRLAEFRLWGFLAKGALLRTTFDQPWPARRSMRLPARGLLRDRSNRPAPRLLTENRRTMILRSTSKTVDSASKSRRVHGPAEIRESLQLRIPARLIASRINLDSSQITDHVRFLKT
jgi:hypothetical protein